MHNRNLRYGIWMHFSYLNTDFSCVSEHVIYFINNYSPESVLVIQVILILFTNLLWKYNDVITYQSCSSLTKHKSNVSSLDKNILCVILHAWNNFIPNSDPVGNHKILHLGAWFYSYYNLGQFSAAPRLLYPTTMPGKISKVILTSLFLSINSSPPSTACMRQWIG